MNLLHIISKAVSYQENLMCLFPIRPPTSANKGMLSCATFAISSGGFCLTIRLRLPPLSTTIVYLYDHFGFELIVFQPFCTAIMASDEVSSGACIGALIARVLHLGDVDRSGLLISRSHWRRPKTVSTYCMGFTAWVREYRPCIAPRQDSVKEYLSM